MLTRFFRGCGGAQVECKESGEITVAVRAVSGERPLIPSLRGSHKPWGLARSFLHVLPGRTGLQGRRQALTGQGGLQWMESKQLAYLLSSRHKGGHRGGAGRTRPFSSSCQNSCGRRGWPVKGLSLIYPDFYLISCSPRRSRQL